MAHSPASNGRSCTWGAHRQTGTRYFFTRTGMTQANLSQNSHRAYLTCTPVRGSEGACGWMRRTSGGCSPSCPGAVPPSAEGGPPSAGWAAEEACGWMMELRSSVARSFTGTCPF
eukprot:COSAG01_NODE_676_length_14324_cov_17.420105_4_plen_115_part_00